MQIMTQAKRTRVNRSPNFPLAGTMRPFGLYPIWAHPVLPGETAQSISVKMRTLSMPVKHPLGGAWAEHWFVYVKLTDIDNDLGQMFISDTYSNSGWTASGDASRFFVKSGQIDWIRKAVERVHAAYFVHDNETPRTVDGVPQVKVNNVSWYQNMIFEPADDPVPVTDGGDMYQHLQGWMMLQQMQMTELTYEKYLETYGVRPSAQQMGDPEILRFARSWTQPVNAVNPADGRPSSAWVWSDEIKMDKSKKFLEPGFIVHIATIRPKVFQKHMAASMIGNLWGFSDWYPSYNLDDPTAGVKRMLKTDPVFAAAATDAGTETLLYDHKDLLMHGEQFINSADNELPYPLPYSSGLSVQTGSDPEDLRGEYTSASDAASWFVGTDPDQQCLYYEGIAHAVVSGHLSDTTL